MAARRKIKSSSKHENILPFLNAASYQAVIDDNHKIAHENYDRVVKELDSVADVLKKLESKLKIRSQQADKIVSNSRKAFLLPIAEIYKRLIDTRSTDMEHLQTMVRAKKRTVDRFTIVIMGRTKAGKSTLFSTLLGADYERIGTGRQRTTRENYTYDLDNGIRLIDTPGVAAADGEEDEAEALKAVDEADLICYLVTNDSIQESEFDFFYKLKRQTKPLIILLNVQYNLEDDDLLELFLEEADEILTGKDVEDHKKRILGYAKKKYNSDSIVVIPVMLLAARLSRQKQNAKLCQRLYQASCIQNALDWIDDSIRNYGSLLTSNTLLGETSVLLTSPLLAIRDEQKACQEVSRQISQKHQESRRKLQRIRQESLKQLKVEIGLIFQKLLNEIPKFARYNWERSSKEQEKAWNNLLGNKLKLEHQLENSLRKIESDYKKKVQEILEEISQDINFSFSGKLGNRDRFSGVDRFSDPGFDVRGAFGYGAIALGVGGVVAGLGALFIPAMAPVSIVAGIGAAIFGVAKNFLSDKTKRQQEACRKIEEILKKQVCQERDSYLDTIEKNINLSCDKVEQEISKYFNGMAKEFETIAKSLSESEQRLSAARGKLTAFFALRILDWCNSRVGLLSSSRLGKEIVRVRREPNRSFKIYLTGSFPPCEKSTQCSQMLGEQIYFYFMYD